MIVNIDEAAELLLERAVSFAQSLGNPHVGTEHVLFAYMTCVGHQDLEQYGLTAGKVVDAMQRGARTVESGRLVRPSPTRKLMGILQELDSDASERDVIATVDNIMYAILRNGANKASNIVADITQEPRETIVERLTPLAAAS